MEVVSEMDTYRWDLPSPLSSWTNSAMKIVLRGTLSLTEHASSSAAARCHDLELMPSHLYTRDWPRDRK